jgi:hypothetical protein
MASHAPDFGRASALPFSAVLGAIPSYPRPVLVRLVARLIEHLDEQDGDPDLEPDDPAEDNADAEAELPEWAVVEAYGTDQRIAAVGRGYAPWHIDRDEPA